MSPAAWWGLGAAIPAVALEWMYRTMPGGWLPWSWVYAPVGVWVGYCIYNLVRQPGSLLDAFVVWAFSTTLCRLLLSVVILQDTVRTGTWVAVGLVIAARLAQTFIK